MMDIKNKEDIIKALNLVATNLREELNNEENDEKAENIIFNLSHVEQSLWVLESQEETRVEAQQQQEVEIKEEKVEIKSIVQLEKTIRKNINLDDMEDVALVELIPSGLIEDIKEMADNYTVSNKDYNILTDIHYGAYSYCNNLNEVKFNILMDALEERLSGYKSTFASMKNKQVINSK